MKLYEPIKLTRAVEATQIPYGGKVTLAPGTTVTVTQALGGSYTANTELGHLVRIEGADADALGIVPVASGAAAPPPPPAPVDRESVEKAIWEQLKTCYDPEIPVNIVELGLVFGNVLTDADGGGFRSDIKFTLTAPGCGMGGVLQKEIEQKVRAIPGVKDVRTEIVFEPPWDRAMMSDAAKLKLGMF